MTMLEAVAVMRRQSPCEMLETLSSLGGDEVPQVDEPPALWGDVLALVEQLPTIEELSQTYSPIQVRLTTSVGMELIALTCDSLGVGRNTLGVLVFPGEQLDLARSLPFALVPMGGNARFTTLDDFEACLDPSPDQHVFLFTIIAAKLESPFDLPEA